MQNEKLTYNKEVALGLSKAIMEGDWEKVNSLIADDFIYEAGGKPPINKIAYIGFMKNVLTPAMRDMNMSFLHVVAINYSNTMTHHGDFLGIPATNNQVTATGQFIREIKDGKVTAEWQTTNMFGLMQAIGALPSN